MIIIVRILIVIVPKLQNPLPRLQGKRAATIAAHCQIAPNRSRQYLDRLAAPQTRIGTAARFDASTGFRVCRVQGL